ncbi:hypothetical protein GLOIN_2v1874888 [Rhizophagus irregularis DAOM 181602=DAOM 197198]|nr:hypothetical protein GLOIN_2v1874888 [Rhizophagus irregularis DAOM 181602=DAOM 197198]
MDLYVYNWTSTRPTRDRTTMIINLLMGTKKAKEDGERRRNSVYRRSHHWILTTGVTKNISCIYVAQRFFTIPKAIRENVNYISLHGGHGSLTDTKRIIRQYTEESESLAPVIDDLTLQREFIVFDLRDPRAIRYLFGLDGILVSVRSPINLSSILVRSQFNPRSIRLRTQIPGLSTSFGKPTDYLVRPWIRLPKLLSERSYGPSSITSRDHSIL